MPTGEGGVEDETLLPEAPLPQAYWLQLGESPEGLRRQLGALAQRGQAPANLSLAWQDSTCFPGLKDDKGHT